MAKKSNGDSNASLVHNVIYGTIAAAVLGMSAWTLNSVKDLSVQFGKADVTEQWLTGEVKSLITTVQGLDHAVASISPQQQQQTRVRH